MFFAQTIQLVPDGTMFLHLVVVVVMVAILNRTLLNPINRILAERDEQIRSSKTEREKLEAERAGKIEQYSATLRDARSDSYHLLERERAEALKRKDEQVRAAKEEISKTVMAQLDDVHIQEEKVRKELEGQAVLISESITARVMHGPRPR